MPPRWSDWRIPSPDYYEFWPSVRREWEARSRWERTRLVLGTLMFFCLGLGLDYAVAGLVFIPLIGSEFLRPRRGAFPPAPMPPETYLASARYCVRGREYGWDSGYVGFADGWLVFEGAESTFSVAPEDFDLIRTSDPRRHVSSNMEPTYGSGIQLRRDALEIIVSSHEPEADAAISRLTFDWARGAQQLGRGLLPPLRVHGSRLGVKRGAFWVGTLACGWFILGQVGQVLLNREYDKSVAVILVSSIVCMWVIAFWDCFLRLRRMKQDLAKLRQALSPLAHSLAHSPNGNEQLAPSEESMFVR